MDRRRTSTALLMVPLGLMAAGSLRDWITPLGYWVAWLLWAAVTAALMRPDPSAWARSWPPRSVTVSYGLLLLGMAISAVVNQDWVTAYQALKILVIAGMFLAMWWLALCVEWQQLTTALYWVLGLFILGLVLTVASGPLGPLPILGGRQDSVVASAGVLWKAGALFLPICLAELMAHPRAWKLHAVMSASCVFLVMVDGSRTAQLVMLATVMGLLVFLAWRGGRWLLLQKLRWLVLVPIIVVGIQFFNAGVNVLHRELTQSSTVVVEGGFVGSVEDILAKTVSNRFGNENQARKLLLRRGISQSISCLPFGCGFGKTATDIGQGSPMPVHNAYLAALGDFGVLGMLGMLGFLLAAWLPIYRVVKGDVGTEQGYFIVAAAGSALGYGMSLMLNTFTTEMSEWGYVILMLAFAWAPAKAA